MLGCYTKLRENIFTHSSTPNFRVICCHGRCKYANIHWAYNDHYWYESLSRLNFSDQCTECDVVGPPILLLRQVDNVLSLLSEVVRR